MALRRLIRVRVTAIISLMSTVNGHVIKNERVIRDVPPDREPDNLNTPTPTTTPPPAPPPTKEQNHARECDEIMDRSSPRPMSGVYEIQPLGVDGPFDVYCDFDTDGGGWTVIQRRVDGSVDFDLGWDDYKAGFGDLKGDFWLGNDKIYYLTKQMRQQLRIELTDKDGVQYYAKYSQFSITGEDDYYKLSVASYSGNSHDSLAYHNGMYFTTKDADHDSDGGNCAMELHGPWWYNSCSHSRLNAPYQSSYIRWYGLPGDDYYLRFTEMKIRSVY